MDPEQPEQFYNSISNYFYEFQWTNVWIGLLIIVLILCSALVSGSEVAFFSLNLKKEDKEQTGLHKLLSKPKELLATILIVNNIVNISIIIITELFLESVIQFSLLGNEITIFIKLVLLTALLLIFGEILPKVYANQNAFLFSQKMVKPMLFLNRIFGFLSRFLTATSDVIDKSGNTKLDIELKDLSRVLNLTQEDGGLEEHKLLEGIVKFGNTEVSQIMTSRVDVEAISISASFNELIQLIQTSGFSRIPVYQDNLDDLKGVIYIKDLIRYLRYEDNFRWQTLVEDVYYITENKKIDDLLKSFQNKKMHMAVVVDEYGGTSGIATLEDVLEEIVGDINNELDASGEQYSKLDDHTYIFEGKIQLIDFCRIIEVKDSTFDEVKGESETLAGLVLEILGRFPEKGQKLFHKDYTFVVLEKEKSRIEKLKVIIDV